MRLFLFLVGGTGSRVMRPLIMQLASGILPVDELGNKMPLEIVPLIIDPHTANEDLKRTDNLLKNYKQIRTILYGEDRGINQGFFATKISTLSDIVPYGSLQNNTFLFNLGTVETARFKEFISYNTLDTANQALCSMLFSDEQLNTKMDIGFVGSPNIGSVALNEFKDSEEFKQFANVFQPNDRVFVVSSIFGGTGAAGYPLIVKNIRNAGHNKSLSNRGNLRDARIGALTVLPYFNIQEDEKSPISRGDFISKTKSALYYYNNNVTGLKQNSRDLPLSKVNVCYYLGDEVPSNPYFNDPGYNGQRNDAHLVEFIGALSILDFLQISDKDLVSVDGYARNPIYKEYGLASDKSVINLKDLGLSTRISFNKEFIKFHLAYLYITHKLKDDIGRGYTQDKPELTKSFLSTSFFNTLTADFYVSYNQWLKELSGNQRSFMPFNLSTNTLSNALNGIKSKAGFLKSTLDYKHILAAMNKESQKALKKNTFSTNNVALKLFSLLDLTLDKLIDDKFESIY